MGQVCASIVCLESHLWSIEIPTTTYSCLSRRLERLPFLSDGLSAEVMPQMRLLPHADIGADAPDVFTERVLQAQLAQFWRNHSLAKGSEYDAIGAEERYESFCSTYLQTLPPVFALQPDKQWDDRLPTLPMHRELLHLAIFELLCWNFRPTVLQRSDQTERLPAYKQVLILHNKRALAVAALNLLEAVSSLHMMMGGSHMRFAGIIVPTFEAAVPLLCLCADKTFPGENMESRSRTIKTDPLGTRLSSVTRVKCMQAVWDAFNRLQNLAEVSSMAEVGARTLSRLIDRVENPVPLAPGYSDLDGEVDVSAQLPETWSFDQMQQDVIGTFQGESTLNSMGFGNTGATWDGMMGNLASRYGFVENGSQGAGYL